MTENNQNPVQDPAAAPQPGSPAAAAPQESQQQILSNDNLDVMNDPPAILRSNYIPASYRNMQEQEGLMCRLEAGGGLLGTSHIDLEPRKRDLPKLTAADVLPTNKDILDKLRDDGIYVDDPQIHQKFTDINVQKLEERLLNNGKSEFFKSNGELKLDNDLLEDEITRPADLAFEETIAYQKKEVNAVLSDRMHAHKKKYYRLDIIIGKINIFNCLDTFGPEDKLALQLREQFKEYETRVSLAMIPFYEERLNHIQEEIDNKDDQATTQEDKDFLDRMLKEATNAYEKEKREIDDMANSLYETWNNIRKQRNEQKFTSTNVQLQVYKEQVNGLEEVNFDLIYPNLPEDQSLTSAERSRQKKAKNLKALCRLFINGKKVTETKGDAKLKFPAFEFDISEMFQVHLFTMPSSIQLQLVIIDGFKKHEVDMIDVEVPGQHVRALTCAASLVRQLPFSKVDYERSKDPETYKQLFGATTDGMTPSQKKKHDSKIATEEKKENNDIRGEIFCKVEWKGEGPKMPPVKSENLFKKAKAEKNRNTFTASEETLILLKQLYLDVNDPRNQFIIKLLRECKNEFLVKLLFDDSKNLLCDAAPFRHKLLAARNKIAELSNLFIPLLENEIIDSTRSSFFLDALEQLFKSEAYLFHLDKRQQLQEDSDNQGFQTQLVSLETLKRRQEIFEALKSRALETRDANSGASANYNAVVEEVQVQTSNPFLALFNNFFQTGRKLKPVVAPRETVAFESVKNCKIFVHCIQGEGIPIREDFFRDFEMHKRGAAPAMIGQMGRNTAVNANDARQGGENVQEVPRDIDYYYNTPQVETYVEVKVQYYSKWAVVKRTKIDEGTMPRWNEVLSFDLEAVNKQNFTKEELTSSQTEVIFTLFDRQIYSQKRDHEIVSTEENRYLGSFTIPLHSVLQNPGKTEFNFKVNRPIHLPNYKVLDGEILLKDIIENDEQTIVGDLPPSYLQVSVSLDPPISLPAENQELSYPGFESNILLQAASEWMVACKKKKQFIKRQAKVFGENIFGQSVLICRYLAPQMPPESVYKQNSVNPDDNKYAIEEAARFVSLVPFKNDFSLFKDMPDTFCDSQQFLDLGAGDHEEHAILLANYFKYIDQKQNRDQQIETFLVFGEALPDGNVVYVMRKDRTTGDVELWSPNSGECYFLKKKNSSNGFLGMKKSTFMQISIADHICPMTKMHTIVSERNIWFNIQKYELPQLLDFNLNNKKKWKVLFENEDASYARFFAGVPPGTIQKAIPIYQNPLPRNEVNVLESSIHKFLVEEFQDARIKRVRKTTKWAVTWQNTLKDMLINFEEHAHKSRNGGANSSLQSLVPSQRDDRLRYGDLNRTINTDTRKRAWGYPLNTTFISLENLYKLVESTRMHEINRLDIEFAMAVHVHPYEANILSVWVYIAAFVDRPHDN